LYSVMVVPEVRKLFPIHFRYHGRWAPASIVGILEPPLHNIQFSPWGSGMGRLQWT
jgi:hypothetical protein